MVDLKSDTSGPPRKRSRRTTSFDVTGLAPIDRGGDDPVVTDLVHEGLRQAILEGALPAGAVISQVVLSQHLGVSRTPLREALRRLEQEGLVDATPNRRAQVRSLDPEDLEFAYANRIMLEALAATISVPMLNEADWLDIDGSVAEMAASVKANDMAAWEHSHRDFHRAIIKHAPRHLFYAIETFAARTVLARARSLYSIIVAQGFQGGPQAHDAIVAACRARDAEGAATLLARHLTISALFVISQVMPEHDPVTLRASLRLIAGSDVRS